MICPGCAHEVKGPKFCELCGSSLEGLSHSAELICPGCGFGNKSGSKFCESCGSSLEGLSHSADLICPGCRHGNKSGSKFCEGCGSSLEGLSHSADLICPGCGSGNKKEAQFCRQCGKIFAVPVMPVPIQPVIQAQPSVKKRSGGNKALAAVGILLIVGFVIISRGNGSQGRTNQSSPNLSQETTYATATPREVSQGGQGSSENQADNADNEELPEVQSSDSDDQAPSGAGEYVLPPTAVYSLVPDPPLLEVVPFVGDPGDTLALTLVNFTPGELVTLDTYSGSTGELLDRFQTIPDNTGSATVSLNTSQDIPFGLYWVEAQGQLSQRKVSSQFFLRHLQAASPSDTDGDGLWDETENWVAETYGPYYVLDEREDRNITGRTGFVFQVTPAPEWWGKGVILTVVGLWGKDLANLANGVTSFVHYGDTEAVEMWIQLMEGDLNTGQFALNRVTMHRHSKSYDYFPGAGAVEFYGTHPVVYTSRFKHGSYPTYDECEASPFWKSFYEDCGGGKEFTAYLPPENNVGELYQPAFTSMDQRITLGNSFPGERVWDRNYNFCGGYDVPDSQRNGSRSYYVDFIVKKFESDSMPFCAGSLGGKWFPQPD